MCVDFELTELGSDSHEVSTIDRHVLNAALGQLSEDHRVVVVLHEIEGLRYEEIADVLQVAVGTVKSRLHYAFEHLRRSLQPREER